MHRATALALVFMLAGVASAAEPAASPAPDAKTEAAPKEPKGFGHRLLYWIPNRVFDVLDVVRFRVRVGPGISVDARATELVDLQLGAHATVFVGLHGPRNQPEIPWPLGFETVATAEVSVAQAGSDEGKYGPQYGPLEVGAGTQLAIIGFDVGVEPYDAFDLLAGIFMFDPKGDDF